MKFIRIQMKLGLRDQDGIGQKLRLPVGVVQSQGSSESVDGSSRSSTPSWKRRQLSLLHGRAKHPRPLGSQIHYDRVARQRVHGKRVGQTSCARQFPAPADGTPHCELIPGE